MSTNWIFEYYKKIQGGEVTVGEYIKTAYEIIVTWLETGVCSYNGKKASKAIKFIEGFCRHSEGRHDLLKLELWQKAAVACIFGVMDLDGQRQFREILLIVARKNGKSLLASAIVAYVVYLDGEYGAKVFCIAPKLEQAEKVADAFWQMVQAEPELLALTKKRRADYYIAETNSSVKALAFNAKKSDGFNPQMVACDEIASWSGEGGLRQYAVMKSALGARVQPLILSTTTAGFANNSIYDALFLRATSFLNGNSRERRLLPLLYIIDDPKKWNDINELRKSNPNMGVSVSEDFFKEEIAAVEASGDKSEFCTKYCNIKQNHTSAWLKYDVVNAAATHATLEDFRGCYCVCGVDLSQTTDLTAASALIERNGTIHCFTQFFMPTDRIELASGLDDVPYEIFEKQGILTLCGEHYVDYNAVFKWLTDLREVYEIYPLMVGYDRYSAQYLIDQLKKYGYQCDDVHQGDNLSPVLHEFEGMLKDGRFKIADNKLLKAHFLNVAVKRNLETRKIKPVKLDERARIDGFVSAIDALTVRQKHYQTWGTLLENGN